MVRKDHRFTDRIEQFSPRIEHFTPRIEHFMHRIERFADGIHSHGRYTTFRQRSHALHALVRSLGGAPSDTK